MNLILYVRFLLIWLLTVAGSLLYLNTDTAYINYGPNDNLRFVGIQINTYQKYSLLALYTIINSVLRTLSIELIHPWLVNCLQNPENQSQNTFTARYGYEVSIVNVVYSWFDWVVSLIIVFSQLDLLLLEMSCHIITTVFTTNMYINKKKNCLLLEN